MPSMRFHGALLPLALAACQSPAAERAAVDHPRVWTTPDPATSEACQRRRVAVAAALVDGLFVIEAGPEPENGRFYADDDFYWLTGVSTPEAALVLVAAQGRLVEQRLYLHPKDANHELWNGPRLAPGADTDGRTGLPSYELTSYHDDVVGFAETAARLLCTGEEAETTLFASAIEYDPVSRFLEPLQAPKDPLEIAAMRTAIDITQEALSEAMRVAVPGAWEFTAEATLEAGFRKRGAEDLAFPSICGSGPFSCVLHYRNNGRQLEAGDLLVMDAGAKYRHYCADVTRTIPVSGIFTPRQREVYTVVYEASRRAAEVLRPGQTLADAHVVAKEHLERHGFAEYFPHGIGHGLGLEVHDAPRRHDVLAPGMVVTIEPGIYIAAEELGVRIEDDYLITEDGAELLSASIPSAPDALEAYLAALRR